MYDIAIIGGASAGLTAGIYAGRKKLNTIILTKQIGGQSLLTDTIENFPGFDSVSGQELSDKVRAQVEKYNVPIKEGVEVESISGAGGNFLIKIKEGENVEAKSIILATGKNPRRLNIPGEREFENKGISFCSTCDAPLYSGKTVVVAGGGNSGLHAGLDLIKYAEKVYLLEFDKNLLGDEVMQEKLKQSNKVEFITNVEIKEIQGSNFVEKVIYKERESGEEKELIVGGVFINIGGIPATDFLKDFVNLNESGEIIVDHKTTETSVKGVFAAGDVTDTKYKQCVIAAGEGAKAVLSAYDYLSKI